MGSGHSLAALVLLGCPRSSLVCPCGHRAEPGVCTGLSLLALPDKAALCPQAGPGGAVGCLGHPCAGTPLSEGALGPR